MRDVFCVRGVAQDGQGDAIDHGAEAVVKLGEGEAISLFETPAEIVGLARGDGSFIFVFSPLTVKQEVRAGDTTAPGFFRISSY